MWINTKNPIKQPQSNDLWAKSDQLSFVVNQHQRLYETATEWPPFGLLFVGQLLAIDSWKSPIWCNIKNMRVKIISSTIMRDMHLSKAQLTPKPPTTSCNIEAVCLSFWSSSQVTKKNFINLPSLHWSQLLFFSSLLCKLIFMI